jgi:ABC-2 type transport system permease protein
MGGIGLSFLAVGAVAAQLTMTSSAANGLAGTIIGATFVFRGLGDVMPTTINSVPTASWWSWLSPFGWAQFTHSVTFPDWRPLIIFPIFVIIAILIAFVLLARRDVGAGLLPAKKGRARASRILTSPFGLTWHLQRNIFLGWLAGNVVLVALIGSMGNQIGDIYGKSSTLSDAIEKVGGAGNLTKSLLSYMLVFVAMTTIAYTVQSLGKLRAEESSGHLESVLATRISRIGWLAKMTLLPAVGAAAIFAICGLVIAMSASASGVPDINTGQYVLGSLAYWPLVALFMGIYLLGFGLWPRVAGAVAWVAFALALFIEEFGALIKGFPEWLSRISPLEQLSGMPAKAVNFTAFWVFLSVGIIFAIIGVIGWRSRNLME